jgi:hypothetical protein
MGGPGRRWSPGGPTCRSADGDVPARCRFGDVTAHSRLGVDVTVSGDVTKLGGAGPLAHLAYSPRGTRSAWRFGGSAKGEIGTEALRGASAIGGGRPHATLLGPSSRRCGFITTWRWETECMLLSRYGDTDPPSLMLLPSAPEWRMMFARRARRPAPASESMLLYTSCELCCCLKHMKSLIFP